MRKGAGIKEYNYKGLHATCSTRMKHLYQLVTLLFIVDEIPCLEVSDCPSTGSGLISASERLGCNKTYVYHCLLNEKDKLVEKCLQFKWMRDGNCPVFIEGANNGRGDLHQKLCNGEGAHKKGCPPAEHYRYQSYEVYRYPICLETSMPARNNKRNISKGVDEGNSSLVNKHNRMQGLKHAPVVSALSGALLSGMSFWLLYLYYKRKYIQRKETDMEHGIREEKERLYKNEEYSYIRPSIVQLNAYTEGLRILKQRGILIITGRTGSGKTTAVAHIRKAVVGKGKHWKVKTRVDSDNGNGKCIIILDDCFGKYVANPVYKNGTVDKLKKLFTWITKNVDNRKAVISMSEIEFSYFSADFSQENEKIKECRLCLDKLNTGEKEKILKSIFKDPRFDTSMHGKMKMKLREMDTKSIAFAALGWPLICRLVSIPEVDLKIENFSKNPLQCLVKIFEDLQSDDEQLYCAMIYTLFKGGNVSRLRSEEGDINVKFLRKIGERLAPSMIPPDIDSQVSENNGKSMNKTEERNFLCYKLSKIYIQAPHYFLRTGSEMFQFHHQIFEFGLLYHFFKHDPAFTIEYLDFDVITELFRPKNWKCEFYELDVFHLCSFNDNFYETVNNEDTTKPKTGQPDNVKNKIIPGWKFVLEEVMVSSVIEKFRKGQREKDLDEHPLLRENAF